MSTTLAEPAVSMVEQQNQTPVVPYVMLIITTHFDLASHVLQRLQSQVPTIEPALSDLTRKKADGCLIVDVPLPDLPQVELLLDTMPKEEVYDYIPVQFE